MDIWLRWILDHRYGPAGPELEEWGPPAAISMLLRKFLVAEQMLTIEERLKMEREARENAGIRTDLPPVTGDRLDSTKEVAQRFAEKAGVTNIPTGLLSPVEQTLVHQCNRVKQPSMRRSPRRRPKAEGVGEAHACISPRQPLFNRTLASAFCRGVGP